MPLISVIMAVYNNEKYFPAAVKSVTEQTFDDWELIIVDDGSTDNTPDIADKFAETDKRIKVIHQKNQWIYPSFNNGIAAAEGEYIYILNSDDSFYDNRSLEKVSDLVYKYNPDVVLTKISVVEINERGDRRIETLPQISSEEYAPNKNSVRKNFINYLKKGCLDNQANLYRTSIAKKHKFRTDIYGADYLYNAQIANDITSVAVCKYPIYEFHEYTSSDMNASVGKYYGYEHDMRNEFFETYYNLFSKWGQLDEEKENYLVNRRFSAYTYELKTFLFTTCPLNFEEKLTKAWDWANDLYEFALRYNRQEEFEARTLRGIMDIIIMHYGENAGSMQFIYDYLESILRYEKDDKDMKTIKNGVFNNANKNNIGICFYEKLKGELF